MPGPITYRRFQEEDLPGLLRLWEEESGWGAISPGQWHKWYVETPHGRCLVIVAVDEQGEIVGQEVFIPSRVIIGDREIPALRLSAPVLCKNLRSAVLHGADHPAIGLYLTGAKAAVADGYGLIYAMTQHAWLPFFRGGARLGLPRVVDAEYACLGLPITSVSSKATEAAGYLTVSPVTNFDARFESLWQSAKDTFPITCGVVRSPAWVHYKNKGHVTLEARDSGDNALVGYTAIKKQTGLLVDILARRPDDLAPVLGATLDWLATEQNDAVKGGIDYLKVMQTPLLRPALDALGFTPVDYRFAFVCASLEPGLPLETFSAEHWYVTPGD